MARARNIKPGFFKNELLVDLPAFDRLLFIGLWCLADREGRVEDRPKRVKMELFPCDDYSVDVGLDSLAKAGFIKRYEADGKRVVAITNFLKHQTPHGTEKDSELPDEHGKYTVHERNNNGCVAGAKRATNRAATKEEQTSNEEITLNNVSSQCRNALNPDSLNPDSLNPEEKHLADAESVRETLPPLFAEAWEAYPKREGGDSRKAAMKAWQARVRSGVAAEDLLAGVLRYAAHCDAKGVTGTQYVKRAASFFGPDEHWIEEWNVVAERSVEHAPKNRDPKKQFLGGVWVE